MRVAMAVVTELAAMVPATAVAGTARHADGWGADPVVARAFDWALAAAAVRVPVAATAVLVVAVLVAATVAATATVQAWPVAAQASDWVVDF
jgi:hypothetical protein